MSDNVAKKPKLQQDQDEVEPPETPHHQDQDEVDLKKSGGLGSHPSRAREWEGGTMIRRIRIRRVYDQKSLKKSGGSGSG